jgi:hypothetical protein
VKFRRAVFLNFNFKLASPMCARYTYNKDTAKLTFWEKLVVYGIVPRGDIRPTDLGPVILPEISPWSRSDIGN